MKYEIIKSSSKTNRAANIVAIVFAVLVLILAMFFLIFKSEGFSALSGTIQPLTPTSWRFIPSPTFYGYASIYYYLQDNSGATIQAQPIVINVQRTAVPITQPTNLMLTPSPTMFTPSASGSTVQVFTFTANQLYQIAFANGISSGELNKSISAMTFTNINIPSVLGYPLTSSGVTTTFTYTLPNSTSTGSVVAAAFAPIGTTGITILNVWYGSTYLGTSGGGGMDVTSIFVNAMNKSTSNTVTCGNTTYGIDPQPMVPKSTFINYTYNGSGPFLYSNISEGATITASALINVSTSSPGSFNGAQTTTGLNAFFPIGTVNNSTTFTITISGIMQTSTAPISLSFQMYDSTNYGQTLTPGGPVYSSVFGPYTFTFNVSTTYIAMKLSSVPVFINTPSIIQNQSGTVTMPAQSLMLSAVTPGYTVIPINAAIGTVPPGSYLTSTGSTATCLANNYCSGDGSMYSCPYGTGTVSSGQSVSIACTAIGPGQYASSSGISSCITGTYSTGNQSICTNVPPGYFGCDPTGVFVTSGAVGYVSKLTFTTYGSCTGSTSYTPPTTPTTMTKGSPCPTSVLFGFYTNGNFLNFSPNVWLNAANPGSSQYGVSGIGNWINNITNASSYTYGKSSVALPMSGAAQLSNQDTNSFQIPSIITATVSPNSTIFSIYGQFKTVSNWAPLSSSSFNVSGYFTVTNQSATTPGATFTYGNLWVMCVDTNSNNGFQILAITPNGIPVGINNQPAGASSTLAVNLGTVTIPPGSTGFVVVAFIDKFYIALNGNATTGGTQTSAVPTLISTAGTAGSGGPNTGLTITPLN